MIDLKKICATELNWKIIAFFHKNPTAVDTARGIAAWLNQDKEKIKEALDFLVNQQVLTSHRTTATTAYAYTQDKKLLEKIDKFLVNRDGGGNV